VITHDRVGNQIQAEVRNRVGQTRRQPTATMLSAVTEQKGATSAPSDDVIGATTTMWKRDGAGKDHDREISEESGMSKQSVCPLLFVSIVVRCVFS
jgi:hypothetical protein